MLSLPPQHRPALDNFWRLVRNSLNDQDQEILRLSALLGSATSAARPQTSDSVAAVRESVLQALEDEGLRTTENEVSKTLQAIWDLDPTEALSILTSRRIATTNALGCWFTSNAPAHRTGYQKVNLRNTLRRDGTLFGCSPFYHQIAVVAAGNGAQLLNAGGQDSEYQVCGVP
jgi:hypothetical protein